MTARRRSTRRLQRLTSGPILYRTGYSLMASSIGTALLGVSFWVLAARFYDPAVLGHNVVLLSAMQLVAAPAWVGQHAVLIRFLPGAGEHSQRLVAHAYLTGGATAAVLAILLALIGPEVLPALEILSSSPQWVLGFAASATVWTLFVLQDSVLTAIREAHWVPVANIAYGVAKLGLLAAVAGALPGYGIFAAWTVPLAVAIVVVGALLLNRLIPAHRARSTPDVRLHDRRVVAAYGIANWSGALLSLVPVALIPVLVANELGAQANAYFYIPWTIAIVLPLIGGGMSTAMTVEGNFDDTSLRGLIRDSGRHAAMLLLPLVALVASAAPLILELFGTGYADEGASTLRLLALAAIPTAVVQFAVGVARVQRRISVIFVTQALSAAGSIALTIVLLRSAGIAGAAVAWLSTQVALAVLSAAWVLRPLLAGRR